MKVSIQSQLPFIVAKVASDSSDIYIESYEIEEDAETLVLAVNGVPMTLFRDSDGYVFDAQGGSTPLSMEKLRMLLS